MWSDWDIVDAEDVHGDPGLEIARVLVWPAEGARDPAALAALDFDHRFFGIPLFIVDPSAPGIPSLSDFAVGFGRDVTICYEFREESGKVEQVSEERGYELSEIFHRILENPEIKTIDEFLGYRRMIRDPRDLKVFAANYDKQRRASPKVLDFLKQRIPAGPDKAGIDIGCGTVTISFPLKAVSARCTGSISTKKCSRWHGRSPGKSSGCGGMGCEPGWKPHRLTPPG
jgi:hypothetical protein